MSSMATMSICVRIDDSLSYVMAQCTRAANKSKTLQRIFGALRLLSAQVIKERRFIVDDFVREIKTSVDKALKELGRIGTNYELTKNREHARKNLGDVYVQLEGLDYAFEIPFKTTLEMTPEQRYELVLGHLRDAFEETNSEEPENPH